MAISIGCFKGACEQAQPIGLGLGLMLGAYEVLKYSNVDPFFGPLLGGALKTVLPEKHKNESVKIVKSAFDFLRANKNNTQITKPFIR